MTMVNVSRQLSSSPPTADKNSNDKSFLVNTAEKYLNNNKVQLKNQMFLESSGRPEISGANRSRSTSPSINEDQQFPAKHFPLNNVDRMTAEHIQRHLQQFRTPQNMLLIPPTPSSESSSGLNSGARFQNGKDHNETKENKSDSLSSNSSTLKSAFSIRSLLSGGAVEKDGLAGQISNEFSNHLSRLAAPFSHIYPAKHLENNLNRPSDSYKVSNGNEDFVDVDGEIIDEEDEGDIDLEEDESLENNEDSKCDDENVSEDGKENSSGEDGKTKEEKEENLTPEEKEKVPTYLFILSCLFNVLLYYRTNLNSTNSNFHFSLKRKNAMKSLHSAITPLS